jgi:hypothetical protein
MFPTNCSEPEPMERCWSLVQFLGEESLAGTTLREKSRAVAYEINIAARRRCSYRAYASVLDMPSKSSRDVTQESCNDHKESSKRHSKRNQ